ncbi:hypothetical protein SUGI_0500500 [Cryptomeria japonica]|nr:hypothetical protein SUGI_0500500 [Cryptomeria japonica]
MDLDHFKRGKEFCSWIGHLWKRAYPLHDPPRMGKSSFVPARNDLYHLELTWVKNNVELHALLMQTKEKSLIIIEDIDCLLCLTDRVPRLSNDNEEEKRSNKVNLSDFLNFTDGLWFYYREEC